jgi:anti-sigma-K factor RskA
MLVASNLPSLPQGKAYQLWFIVGNKAPMPGKTFAPNSTGQGVIKEQMPREALNSPVFAVTVEPAGGVAAPTGPIYLSSSAVN